MSLDYWEIIESDDGQRFACQRSLSFGYDEYETARWFSSVEEAESICDLLNLHVVEEGEYWLPDHLKSKDQS